MGTPFNEVYELFLEKISDYLLPSLTNEEISEFCHGKLISSIPKVRQLENPLDKYDDASGYFDDELLQIEKEMIALQMVSEWVEPQLNNTLLTRQFIGTKDEKFYAQKNQIEALRDLRDDAMFRSQKLRRNYRYQNNDYFGG